MRLPKAIKGMRNSQRIRVIINGIGFYTTVGEAVCSPFRNQRIALECVLNDMVRINREAKAGIGQAITGIGRMVTVESAEPLKVGARLPDTTFEVQVDLL